MKTIRCRDIGMDCDFKATGETEQEVIEKAAAHAKVDHGMAHISTEVMEKVKGAIGG